MKIFSKFKFIIVSTLSMLLMFVSSCSAGTTTNIVNTDLGQIEYLETLVSNGIISEYVLMNIATLRYGSLAKIIYKEDYSYELKTILYEPTPIEDELTTDQKEAIITAYNNFLKDSFTASGRSYTVTEIEITAYYGTYNDYIIVETCYYPKDGIPEIAVSYVVGDYFLGWAGVSTYIIGWTQSE